MYEISVIKTKNKSTTNSKALLWHLRKKLVEKSVTLYPIVPSFSFNVCKKISEFYE